MSDREHRGRPALIRDPAVAAAAAKCFLARWKRGAGSRMIGIGVDSFHPDECDFCEYPPARLVDSLREFVSWSGFDRVTVPGDLVTMRAEVEMFETLPRHEQARLVRKAQGYEEGGDEATSDHAAGA